ncbi:SatD family protein [Nocardioides psychrotolerans]|uniref:SatD family protein n=1 Tax=Nocardioides psychrotolerans TaxID=1005945 RepID=UPI0031383EBD
MPLLHPLIGDVVGSRAIADRAGFQVRLAEVLDEVSALLSPAQVLETTVGDEFQGAFTTIADAALAALLVRLALLPDADVRCGLGHGEVTVHGQERRPLLQDGPGWWAARDALDVLGAPRRAAQRTWYVGPDAGRVNAFLLTRDALVDRLGDRGWRLLASALAGASQTEIAAAEGISKSAVSQQFARGVGAVRDAHRSFAADLEEDSREPGAGGPVAGRDRGR